MDSEGKDKSRTGGAQPDGREAAFSVIDRRPVARDDARAAEEPRYPTVVEDLKARAEEAERRAREISAAYRKIEDERDAFRERLTRDLERRVDIARVEMMRKILGVVDDLDRALEAGAGAPDPGALLSGVGLIRDHLMRVLASEGVTALDLVGQRFDPAVAEAISVEVTAEPEDDERIVEQNGRGYMLGATLLRPARVRVARSRTPAAAAPADDPAENPGPDRSRRRH